MVQPTFLPAKYINIDRAESFGDTPTFSSSLTPFTMPYYQWVSSFFS